MKYDELNEFGRWLYIALVTDNTGENIIFNEVHKNYRASGKVSIRVNDVEINFQKFADVVERNIDHNIDKLVKEEIDKSFSSIIDNMHDFNSDVKDALDKLQSDINVRISEVLAEENKK